jgi:hypothetical protein
MHAGNHRAPNRLWVGGIVATSVLLSACRMGPCDERYHPSGRYRANVRSLYDKQSPYLIDPAYRPTPEADTPSCTSAFGTEIDAVVEFKTVGTDDFRGMCTMVVADLTAADGVEVLGRSRDKTATLSVQDGFFHGAEDVAANGCRGVLAFTVFATYFPDGPFSEPVPGKIPPAVLYRLFLPDEASSATCPRCADSFVIKLDRVTP